MLFRGRRHPASGIDTPALDDDQASAGAQSASTALLHPWKATATVPLSRSMRLSAPAIPSRGDGALPLSSVAA
jgi:hypothetical protein